MFAGYAYGGSVAYYMCYIADIVPPSKQTTAIAIVTIAMTIGGFTAPYI